MSCQQLGFFFMIQVTLAVFVTYALSSAGSCRVVPLILFEGTWSWSSSSLWAVFASLPLGAFVAWKASSLNHNSFAVSI